MNCLPLGRGRDEFSGVGMIEECGCCGGEVLATGAGLVEGARVGWGGLLEWVHACAAAGDCSRL